MDGQNPVRSGSLACPRSWYSKKKDERVGRDWQHSVYQYDDMEYFQVNRGNAQFPFSGQTLYPVLQQRDMQANVEPMHVGLDQGRKAGEILAEARQAGSVVLVAGCRVQPQVVRRH